jgi:organic radical activating enzyme
MIDKFLKKSKTFCVMPFIHINHKQNDMIGACWRSLPVGDLQKESFEEIWNNKNIRRIRKQLLNNERPPECINCWKLEDGGVDSYRIRINTLESSKEKAFCDYLSELNEKDYNMPYKISYIELRLSNKCNFHCRMCSPRFSSNWEKEWGNNKKLRDYIKSKAPKSYNSFKLEDKSKNKKNNSKEKILELVRSNAKYIKYLMIGGGEPMLIDEYYEILDILKPYGKNIELEYTSNLNALGYKNKKILDYWPYFKKIFLKVSVDGDRFLYPYIRRNASVKKLEKNIRVIEENINQRKLRLALTCTTSVYNIERLPEALKWFTELGVWVHTSLVLYPDFLSVQIMPKKLKKEITKKIEDFLLNLEKNIDWSKHKNWKNKGRKKRQKEIIKEYAKDCINFMNSKDRSESWKVFLGYNDILDNKKNSILDIYPHWEKYI